MSIGHDESKLSVNNGKAYLCILSCDASDRLKEEFVSMCRQKNVALTEIPFSMEQLAFIIGSKAAVITVNDEGLSKKLMTYREVNI